MSGAIRSVRVRMVPDMWIYLFAAAWPLSVGAGVVGAQTLVARRKQDD